MNEDNFILFFKWQVLFLKVKVTKSETIFTVSWRSGFQILLPLLNLILVLLTFIKIWETKLDD